MFRRRVILILAAATMSVGGAAGAAGMGDVVKARQAQLKALGADFKLINDESRRGKPDMKRLRVAAASVRKASVDLPRWFPAGSGPEAGVGTKTKTGAWTDAAGFAQASRDFAVEAAKLQTIVAQGDVDEIRSQAKTVGQTCGQCHAKYREK